MAAVGQAAAEGTQSSGRSAAAASPASPCRTALGRAQLQLSQAGCTTADMTAFCSLLGQQAWSSVAAAAGDAPGRAGALADMALDRAMVREANSLHHQ